MAEQLISEWLDSIDDRNTPGGQFTAWLSDRSQVLCSRWIVAHATLEVPTRSAADDAHARGSLSAIYSECSRHGGLASMLTLALRERLSSFFVDGLAQWHFEQVRIEGVFTAPTAHL